MTNITRELCINARGPNGADLVLEEGCCGHCYGGGISVTSPVKLRKGDVECGGFGCKGREKPKRR